MATKVLLLGARGQVGSEISRLAKTEALDLIAYGRDEVDICDPVALRHVFSKDFDVVINAAAYTAVDLAETEQHQANAVNYLAVAEIAALCKEYQIPLLHISTDYVFDGKKAGYYLEGDIANPLSVYGRSKLKGEQAIINSGLQEYVIVRTSWVFGQFGKNFVKTILRLAKEREELKVIDDQVGGPTAALDIAQCLLRMAKYIANGKGHWGIYHYAGKPDVSWYGFTRAITDIARHSTDLKLQRIIPIATEEYPLPAVRPKNSKLDCAKLTEHYGIAPCDWRASLQKLIPLLLNMQG